VDSLDAVGDIPTKISTGYVMILHVALSFMCYFMGFISCVIITFLMFKGIPLCMMHVCFYC
jgi:hypothetical protein